jgi:hypothetical protein
MDKTLANMDKTTVIRIMPIDPDRYLDAFPAPPETQALRFERGVLHSKSSPEASFFKKFYEQDKNRFSWSSFQVQ